MRVWLITVGEPLPTDRGAPRLLRTGLLAQVMVSRGHHVTWWTSSFNHSEKVLRCRGEGVAQPEERLEIRFLESLGYSRNIGLRRLADHRRLGRSFRRQAAHMPSPDLILCSLPTLELAQAAVAYGAERCLPVVIDVRDLWPDLFLELVPAWARPLVRPALSPMFRMARRACTGATAIVGVTDEYVAWGLNAAARAATELDRSFPMAYTDDEPPPGAQREARSWWAERGIRQDGGSFIACYFGAFGPQRELETVIEAARLLSSRGEESFRFVLSGTGDTLARCRNLASDLDSVLLPGWIDWAKIWVLMRMAAAGLAPYESVENFTKNIPNKPIEYFSAGLPVVSSLQGALKTLLETWRCGVTYANRDPQALAAALVQLKAAPQQRQHMAANATGLFQARYVARRVYAEMSEHLERTASDQGTRTST